MGEHLPRHRHRPEDVGLEDTADLGLREVFETSSQTDAGVVDQAVDPPRPGHDSVNGSFDTPVLGHVELENLHLDISLFRGLVDRRSEIEVAKRREDHEPAPGEMQGRLETETR